MIAVTGATGQLGRLVIASLVKKMGEASVVALARDPGHAADLAALGVDVRPFDYDAPDRLASSLAGVRRLLLISSDDVEYRVRQHRAAIDATAHAKLDLIAYTSCLHADTNPMSLGPSHRETERMIVATGRPHAILRNGWYIENFLMGVDAVVDRVVLPGSAGGGRISAATRADYADAAAVILTGEATNKIYELAGDEGFTLTDVAAAMSQAAGRPVAYHDLPEETYRDVLVEGGAPLPLATAVAEYSARSSTGILADDTRTLSKVIGHPTERMRDVIERTLSDRSAR